MSKEERRKQLDEEDAARDHEEALDLLAELQWLEGVVDFSDERDAAGARIFARLRRELEG